MPDRWVYHYGIALMREDDESCDKACDLVLREFEKINKVLATICLVKISFLVEEIFVDELKGE